MSNILIGVTGCIAAYKVADITSALKNLENDVKIIMTENAKKFITPLTLATISKNPVYDESSEWATNSNSIKHIELSKWADMFVIVPATANTISKIRLGIADNLLTSTYLAFDTNKQIVICPAMNTKMWEKEKIQEHVSVLNNRKNHHIIKPIEGNLACGDIGVGKLQKTVEIVNQLKNLNFGKASS